MSGHPLENVFMTVPLQFSFFEEDWHSLACTTRTMGAAIESIQKCRRWTVDRLARLSLEDDGVIALPPGALPESPDDVVGEALFEVEGILEHDQNVLWNLVRNDEFDQGCPYIKTQIPRLPCMRYLDCHFVTPCAIHQNVPVAQPNNPVCAAPELDLSSLPDSLEKLTISCEYHWDNPVEGATPVVDKRCKILFTPPQNFSTMFPRLVCLRLFGVCCKNMEIELPNSLEYLHMCLVTQLELAAFPPNLQHLDVGLAASPHSITIPADIPESVRYLTVSTENFLRISIPVGNSIKQLHLFSNGPQSVDPLALSTAFNNCQFEQLQNFTTGCRPRPTMMIYPSFFVLSLPPVVNHFEGYFDRCHRVDFQRCEGLRTLQISSCQQDGDLVLPPSAENIRLRFMPNIKRITIPRACNKLILGNMDELEEIVFDSCTPSYIYFTHLPNLQVVRGVNGADIPNDIPTPIQRDLEGDFTGDPYERQRQRLVHGGGPYEFGGSPDVDHDHQIESIVPHFDTPFSHYQEY